MSDLKERIITLQEEIEIIDDEILDYIKKIGILSHEMNELTELKEPLVQELEELGSKPFNKLIK